MQGQKLSLLIFRINQHGDSYAIHMQRNAAFLNFRNSAWIKSCSCAQRLQQKKQSVGKSVTARKVTMHYLSIVSA